MSRKAAIVEEFDDDTDLPLPSHPLPNTGKGPLLEEIRSDNDDDDFDLARETQRSSRGAGPASPSRYPGSGGAADDAHGLPASNANRVTDITPYKNWTCIYPIYIDAKRPYGTGQRRVERAKSVWWPLSKDIADAASRLGLGTLHEVNKAHPRDWENPGRVRVQWKKEGRLMNPAIKTKKQLLEMVCFQIQLLKPENTPKPPYNTSHVSVLAPSSTANNTSTPSNPTPTPPTKDKGKQPLSSTSFSKSKASLAATATTSPSAHPPPPHPRSGSKSGRNLPIPPDPLPSLANRVSAYSPALPTGVLIETVKAGMNAAEGPGPAGTGVPGGAGPGIGAGAKGKRKVVRVRG
ncbi:hypothetical protein CPB84DRAFT_1680990 [Gymnopilus junonius]|uniref:Signal recognition particle, SRP19 subunit n=1 Tax=Gymnopilus junonius TaxID=109634 RepID=A0A9P5TLU0_GYMJU|nr:hypothetical protein CPB84DRAFT_1680990 [Gymnopilus junonius]